MTQADKAFSPSHPRHAVADFDTVREFIANHRSYLRLVLASAEQMGWPRKKGQHDRSDG